MSRRKENIETSDCTQKFKKKNAISIDILYPSPEVNRGRILEEEAVCNLVIKYRINKIKERKVNI